MKIFDGVDTRGKQFAYLYILVTMILSITGVLKGNIILAIASVTMLIIFPVVCKSFERAVTVMLMMYFFIDQLSFQILGGTFRIYFVISIIIILMLSSYWKNIFESPIMRSLVLWIIVGILFCIISSSPIAALISFTSTILQMLSGFAVYLLLVSRVLDLAKIDRLFIIILSVMFGFGIIQLIIYRATGIGVGLNPMIVAGQLSIGQIPSFRYEGNALGKLLGWGVIFCIPPLVSLEGTQKKKYKYLLMLLLVFLIISITRTVLYALVFTIGFAICWYIYRKRGSSFLKIILFLILMTAVAILAIQFNIIRLGEYSVYKLQHMFLGVEEALQDGSAGYRLQLMKQGFDIWFSSLKNIFTGVGYARATADLSYIGGSSEAEVGGCDLVSIGVSLGVIGLVVYLRILLKAFVTGIKATLKMTSGSIQQIWSERILLAVVFYFALQSLSGSLLSPEFWMTFGIIGYVAQDPSLSGSVETTIRLE